MYEEGFFTAALIFCREVASQWWYYRVRGKMSKYTDSPLLPPFDLLRFTTDQEKLEGHRLRETGVGSTRVNHLGQSWRDSGVKWSWRDKGKMYRIITDSLRQILFPMLSVFLTGLQWSTQSGCSITVSLLLCAIIYWLHFPRALDNNDWQKAFLVLIFCIFCTVIHSNMKYSISLISRPNSFNVFYRNGQFLEKMQTQL